MKSKVPYAFISRHKPTRDQEEIAAKAGIVLIPIGDMDAFTVDARDVDRAGPFAGVVIVHPAAAMRLQWAYIIGVFENAQRAGHGERPTFEAKALHLFDERSR